MNQEPVSYEPVESDQELRDSLDDMKLLMEELRTRTNVYGEAMTPEKLANTARMLASYCLSVAGWLAC